MFNWRNKLQQFMEGRNGNDEFSRATLMLALIMFLINIFVKTSFFYFIALVLVIYTYFRFFSRNTYARSRENEKYLEFTYKLRTMPAKMKKRQEQSKYYRFFSCPNCHQKVRVPKGKGKIQITCPKCRTTFIKKS